MGESLNNMPAQESAGPGYQDSHGAVGSGGTYRSGSALIRSWASA
jgi:hypothetical protein